MRSQDKENHMQLSHRTKWIVGISLMVFAVTLRFFPHPANFSAATAIFFLAPLVLKPRTVAIALALVLMLISDAIIGFYPGISFVYLSYALIAGLGFFQGYLKQNSNAKVKWLGWGVNTLAGAVLFFVFSNLGVFFMSGLYPQTVE